MVQSTCKTFWLFKKLNTELPHDLAILLLGMESNSKELKTGTQIGTCTPLFIKALFTVAKSEEGPKSPPTEELIKKKQNVVYTMDYYSPIKTKEVVIPATIWTKLEHMLIEISQIQKHKYYMIPLI